MDISAPREPDPPPASAARDHAAGILATATVLAILYLGRDVLIPVTLAAILSLLVAPFVRQLRRIGLGQTASVLTAVIGLAVSVAVVTGVIGVQVVRMTASLPHYEGTIRHKLATLDDLTIGRLKLLDGQAGRFRDAAVGVPQPSPLPAPAAGPAGAAPPLPVEVHEPQANSLVVLQRVLGSIWVPLESTGIVLVVLVFVLLEHEAVRDRFIRVAGGTDIRATTLALNDAGERLSRFFVSQFCVNFGFALTVWIGLTIVGLPHALVWGALSGVLRFVPYIGVWIAALFATLLAAAVDPGWTLALSTLGLYVIVELIVGQVIEPQLYGHATGLSPLSVVVAAIFWSWLWGAAGLIVSTPLTLCLVVAGRHIKALNVLDLLLGDAQALTMPQRFYQRALSGDADELIRVARIFLKRNSFAAYCDVALMPALALGRLDLETGATTREQQAAVRRVVVSVIAAIGGEPQAGRRRPSRGTALHDAPLGSYLRRQREKYAGPFQGPLTVPPGSIMLCMGLGSTVDELAAELLVRVLREQKVDARHVSVADFGRLPPPEASPDSVAVAYLVSAFPSDERQHADRVAGQVLQRFPGVRLVALFLPGILLLQPGPVTDPPRAADEVATSFGQALQICLDMLQEAPKPANVRVAG